jgi:hypothetical protein
MPESNHSLADLGTHTWTQNISLLSANRRKRLTLQVGQSENFGLGNGGGFYARVRIAAERGSSVLTTARGLARAFGNAFNLQRTSQAIL